MIQPNFAYRADHGQPRGEKGGRAFLAQSTLMGLRSRGAGGNVVLVDATAFLLSDMSR